MSKFLIAFLIFIANNPIIAKNYIEIPKQNTMNQSVYETLIEMVIKDRKTYQKCLSDDSNNLNILIKTIYEEKNFIVFKKEISYSCKHSPTASKTSETLIYDKNSGKEKDFKSEYKILDSNGFLKTNTWKYIKNKLLNDDRHQTDECFDMIEDKNERTVPKFNLYPVNNGLRLIFDFNKQYGACFEDVDIPVKVLEKL